MARCLDCQNALEHPYKTWDDVCGIQYSSETPLLLIQVIINIEDVCLETLAVTQRHPNPLPFPPPVEDENVSKVLATVLQPMEALTSDDQTRW